MNVIYIRVCSSLKNMNSQKQKQNESKSKAGRELKEALNSVWYNKKNIFSFELSFAVHFSRAFFFVSLNLSPTRLLSLPLFGVRASFADGN